jgi:hypothetical protein
VRIGRGTRLDDGKDYFTIADLGKPEEIGRLFAGFQKYLYEKAA